MNIFQMFFEVCFEARRRRAVSIRKTSTGMSLSMSSKTVFMCKSKRTLH